MIYPVKEPQLVKDGQFGSDPLTYKTFGLVGHNGSDFVAYTGTPIYAPEDATVYKSADGVNDEYTGSFVSGETIVLRGTMENWLLHLSKRLVKAGDKVKEGQLIGHTGNTGYSTGPHLHWGIRPLNPDIKNGYRGFIDPMEYMRSQGGNNDVIDTENKARDVLLGILHEPNPTKDAIQSIIGQPYEIVVPALIGYQKWRDQNDKLVAYPNLQSAVTGLQAQINANGNTELKEAIDKVIGLLEAKK